MARLEAAGGMKYRRLEDLRPDVRREIERDMDTVGQGFFDGDTGERIDPRSVRISDQDGVVSVDGDAP